MSNIIDPNLWNDSKIDVTDCEFYDVREEPFAVYGLYKYREESDFKRLPDNVAEATSKGVAHLAYNTAGGRLRFSTDSDKIVIKADMPKGVYHSHKMSLIACGGFDLYVDDAESGLSRFHKIFLPQADFTDVYQAEVKFPTKKLRYITIHFPSYAAVKDLYVGIKKDAVIGKGLPYRDIAPIVYYGSSITQGANASRPGNNYENIVCRRTGIDYINLGFSGNGKGEDAIVEYMKTLKMSAFVSDYDHNAPCVEHLQNTHLKLYKAIREVYPDIPYFMLSRPDFDSGSYDDNILRRDVVIDTYRYAREHGDRNVYYIDGASIFRGPYEDQCTVDGTHPNDLGFALMADAILAEFKRAQTQHYF